MARAFLAYEQAIEDAGGLREAAEGGARDAQDPLDLPELAGLLESAEGLADGVEHEEQEERQVLVHVEPAVVGAVAGAAVLMETREESADLLEILETEELGLLDCVSFGLAHDSY